MTLVLVITLVVLFGVSVAVVVTVLKVVSRATGNLFDWVVLTFGNDDAVKNLKDRQENS